MDTEQRVPASIGTLGAVLAGGLLLVALFPAAGASIGPFVLLLTLFLLLWPHRTEDWGRSFLAVGILFFAVWFVWTTRTVLTPFALGLLLAYLLDPLIDRIEGWGVPRTVAIATLLVVSLALLGLALLIVVPVVADQIGALSQDMPRHVQTVQDWVGTTLFPFLEKFGFSVHDTDLTSVLAGEGGAAGVSVQKLLGGALQVTSGLYTVLAQLLNVLLVPVVAFYLLKDYDAMVAWAAGMIPPARLPAIRALAEDLGEALGNYLRGQFGVSLFIGVLYGVGLGIAGIQYAALLGLTAAVLSLIPYVGSLLTFLLAALVALLGPVPLTGLIRVAIVYGVVQLLDANFITPKIMGDRVGLHPVIVMLAVLVFAALLGFVGLLIAVPLTAVIKVGVDRWLRVYHSGPEFERAAGPAAEGEGGGGG